MTRAEAKQALREKKKLTHTYFSRDEWVMGTDDGYLLEDGVRCTESEFWNYRKSELFDHGWELYFPA